MRPTPTAASVVLTSLAAIFTSTACATKGFMPRIVSETVIIRTVDERSALVAGTLVPATPAIQQTTAPKAQAVPERPKRSEPKATGTIGFTDIEALIAAAFPSFAAPSAPTPAASGTSPQSATRSKVEQVSIAAGAVVVALALVGALGGAMFYLNRSGRRKLAAGATPVPAPPATDRKLESKPDSDLHLAWILGAEDPSKVRRAEDPVRQIEIGLVEHVEDFPTELQLPSARH